MRDATWLQGAAEQGEDYSRRYPGASHRCYRLMHHELEGPDTSELAPPQVLAMLDEHQERSGVVLRLLEGAERDPESGRS
jgi:hypothetical protein